MHGNAKSEAELRDGAGRARGPDRGGQLRRARPPGAADRRGRAEAERLSRCSSGSRPTCGARRTRRSPPARPTPSSASRWPMRPRRSSGSRASTGSRWPACTRTSARSCSSSSRFAARSRSSRSSARRTFPVWDLGGGLGVAYTEEQPAPAGDRGVCGTLVRAAREHGMGGSGKRLLIEPGRALTANAGVTLYTVESVKRNVSTLGRRRRRDVRQPAPDALRRALRSARRRPLRRRRPSACSRASTASPAT